MRVQEQERGIEALPFKNTLNGKTRDYAEEKQHAAPKEGYHAPVSSENAADAERASGYLRCMHSVSRVSTIERRFPSADSIAEEG